MLIEELLARTAATMTPHYYHDYVIQQGGFVTMPYHAITTHGTVGTIYIQVTTVNTKAIS